MVRAEVQLRIEAACLEAVDRAYFSLIDGLLSAQKDEGERDRAIDKFVKTLSANEEARTLAMQASTRVYKPNGIAR